MWARFFLVLVCVVSITTGASAQAQPDKRDVGDAVDVHAAQAQAYERAGDWPAAEREWLAVVSAAPGDARAWVNLGVALNRQNETAQALSAWQRAAQLDPNLAGAHFN